MTRQIRLLVLLLAGLTLSAVGQASAQYPIKGKPIIIVVPNAPGGINDVTARLMAPILEKELGTPVQVVNKAGAATQTGLTEAALARPDGHTLAVTSLPGTATIYLDPDRQAVPQIREFKKVALHNIDVGAVVVRADSPYKSLKQLIDAAKANPGGLTTATDGLMGADHMATLYFEKVTGIRLRLVHFDSGAPATTALAGGHVDLRIGKVGSVYAQLSAGTIRLLAVMDKERSKFAPSVPTMIEEGFPNYTWYAAAGISVPRGTPQEIVDILAKAIKTTVDSDDAKKKLGGLALTGRYMGSAEYDSYWNEYEKVLTPLVATAKPK